MKRELISLLKRSVVFIVCVVVFSVSLPVTKITFDKVYAESVKADNLIVNGEFNDGMSSYIANTSFNGSVTTEDGDNYLIAKSKSKSSISGTISQTVTVDNNTDYIFSFKARRTNQSSVNSVISILGGTSFDEDLITAITSSGGFDFTKNAEQKGYNLQFSSLNTWDTFKIRINSEDYTSIKIQFNLMDKKIVENYDKLTLFKYEKGSIENGGFDDGMLSFEFDSEISKKSVVSEIDGNKVLNVSGSATLGKGSFWQDVEIDENTNYKWSFRIKESSADNKTFVASVLSGELFNTDLILAVSSSVETGKNIEMCGWNITPKNNYWHTISISFNSGNNSVIRLNCNLLTNDRNTFFDDWILEKADSDKICINNGDFEKGKIGFDFDDNLSKSAIVTESDENKALNISGSSVPGSGSFWQTVKVNKNTNYLWSFRAKESSGTWKSHIVSVLAENSVDLIETVSAPYVNLTENNSELNGWTIFMPEADQWYTYTVKFNSKDNDFVKLNYNVLVDTRNAFVDDFQLEEYRTGVYNGDFSSGKAWFAFDKNISKCEIVTESGNKILNVSGGTTGTGSFCQDIYVDKDTDYVWSFKMREDSGDWKSHIVSVFGGEDFGTNLIQNESDVYASVSTKVLADENYKGFDIFAPVKGKWYTYIVRFNSGNNTRVRLNYNLFYNGRDAYLDDFDLFKVNKGDIINGDFERGSIGFVFDSNLSKATIVKEENNSILNVSGSSTPGKGAFWQDVRVKANTSYEWKFKMREDSDDWKSHRIFVLGGSDFNTNLISKIKCSEPTNIIEDEESGGWDIFAPEKEHWYEFTVRFSTNENTIVKLYYDLYYNGRNAYIDDWKLSEYEEVIIEPVLGQISNGDFESGYAGFDFDNNLSKDEIVTEESGNKVLNVSGSVTPGGGTFWQDVLVKPNTDYTWSFRMKENSGDWKSHVVSVLGGSGFNEDLIAEVSSPTGNRVLLHEELSGWDIFAPSKETWYTFNVRFNTGANSKVRLKYNLYVSSRDAYIDDWALEEFGYSSKDTAKIVNGDFENGTSGFTTDKKTSKFEIIEDPDNKNNHILNFSGSTEPGKGAFWQDVKVNPDTDYIWTFRMKENSGTFQAHVVSVLGGLSFNESLITDVKSELATKLEEAESSMNGWYVKIPTANQWDTFTVSFNSGDNSYIRLKYNAYYFKRDAYVDDWALTEVKKDSLIENNKFENGTNGYQSEGELNLSIVNSPNSLFGEQTMKITGSGTLKKSVAVSGYTAYKWKFWIKSNNSSVIRFGAVSKKSGQLVSSNGGFQIKYLKSADINNTEFTYERSTADLNGYHTLTTEGGWSQVFVSFNSASSKEFYLVMIFDNAVVYTDNWVLNGKFEYPYETVLNGSFEDGMEPYFFDDNINANLTTDSHSGSSALRITKKIPEGRTETVSNLQNVYQFMRVQKNSHYMLKVWLKFNNDTLEDKEPIGLYVLKNGGSYLFTQIGADSGTIIDSGNDWQRIRFTDNEWHEYKLLIDTGDAEVIKVCVSAYTKFSDFTIDDLSLEYIDKVSKNDVIYDLDFESEVQNAHDYLNNPWHKTDEMAHSGKYSMKYDASSSRVTTTILKYLNDYGVLTSITPVQKNSTYKLSFWYKGTGNKNLTDIRIYQEADKILDEKGFPVKQNLNYYMSDSDDWEYIEVLIDTKNSNTVYTNLSGKFTGSKTFQIYIDDIKLEKVSNDYIIPGYVKKPYDGVKQDVIAKESSIFDEEFDFDFDWLDEDEESVSLSQRRMKKTIERVFIPSGRKTLLWILVLSIAGGVLVAGGTALFILLKIKKNRIKKGE